MKLRTTSEETDTEATTTSYEEIMMQGEINRKWKKLHETGGEMKKKRANASRTAFSMPHQEGWHIRGEHQQLNTLTERTHVLRV